MDELLACFFCFGARAVAEAEAEAEAAVASFSDCCMVGCSYEEKDSMLWSQHSCFEQNKICKGGREGGREKR